MRFLAPDVTEAARQHAMASFPKEACGGVTQDGYIPFRNVAAEPEKFFDCAAEMEPYILAGELLALIHSHPGGPEGPSAYDIQQQIAMDIPWGIVLCSDGAAAPPYFWGDSLTPPPLLGRQFRHGPSGTDGKGDCYALIRDYYRLEMGITLPEGVRDDDWWKRGGDLYRSEFSKAGFFVPPDGRQNPRIGDVLLFQYCSQVPNHGGVYIGNGDVLHHLGSRVSKVEPLIRWRGQLCMWLRYDQ